MTNKPATMANKEGESPIYERIRKPPIESNLQMLEAGEASSTAGTMLGKTINIFFMAAREQ
jgi:hypothetical protein